MHAGNGLNIFSILGSCFLDTVKSDFQVALIQKNKCEDLKRFMFFFLCLGFVY